LEKIAGNGELLQTAAWNSSDCQLEELHPPPFGTEVTVAAKKLREERAGITKLPGILSLQFLKGPVNRQFSYSEVDNCCFCKLVMTPTRPKVLPAKSGSGSTVLICQMREGMLTRMEASSTGV
jgi:hypothetical protein